MINKIPPLDHQEILSFLLLNHARKDKRIYFLRMKKFPYALVSNFFIHTRNFCKFKKTI
jgi:hypothetical protein